MFESQIKYGIKRLKKHRICQGDLIRGLGFSVGGTASDNNEVEFQEIDIGYGIILSQDCDLEQDYESRKNNSDNHDKLLDMILVCPAYPSEQFLTGIHLKDRNMRSDFGKTELNKLKNNELSRYHYMNMDLNFNVPSLVVDFKHFFTVPRETIYEQYGVIYLGTISELYRERLSQRFANYVSRIGLPEQGIKAFNLGN